MDKLVFIKKYGRFLFIICIVYDLRMMQKLKKINNVIIEFPFLSGNMTSNTGSRMLNSLKVKICRNYLFVTFDNK